MRPCPCPCPSNSIHAVLKSTTVFVSPPFASPRGCESVSSRDSFASMHCPTNDPNAFVYRQCRLHHLIRCRDIYIYTYRRKSVEIHAVGKFDGTWSNATNRTHRKRWRACPCTYTLERHTCSIRSLSGHGKLEARFIIRCFVARALFNRDRTWESS